MTQIDKKLSISVIGAGYVGVSVGVLLSQKHRVCFLDIDESIVHKINSNQSPIKDVDVIDFLKNRNLDISASIDAESALSGADIILISTPTNFNSESNSFDTSIVESSIQKALEFSPTCLIVIKSTLPIGFTSSMQLKYNTKRIIFCPEFLQEGNALKDNLNPSRIIIGGPSEIGVNFVNIMKQVTESQNIPILFMDPSEAEAVKLFSNSYLAMRVAYFNELDSFALHNNLDTRNILEGVSLDSRIGSFYNNPSFGYGGYCLPKDTKQLLSNFSAVPQKLIKAIIDSNQSRKQFIADQILSQKPKLVGVYTLAMKSGSDNFRFSAILDIIEILHNQGIEILIYEPSVNHSELFGYAIENNLDLFVKKASLIIANRKDEFLESFSSKIFTRDIFRNN